LSVSKSSKTSINFLKPLFVIKKLGAETIASAPFFFAKSYSSEIASTGQPSAQAPQLMQASASITYWVSPSLIAPQGQVSAHAPQEMH
jgi:hypothetical protein